VPARDLSDRERALIEAARREAAAKKRGNATPHDDAPRGMAAAPAAPGDSPSVSAGAAGPSFATAVRTGTRVTPGTPLDQPTVVGRDHPAARASGEAARGVANDRERWARVGELLKAEHMAEEARRERLRRNGLGAIAALLLIVLVAVLSTLLPGASR
jgi:hypothetical protein